MQRKKGVKKKPLLTVNEKNPLVGPPLTTSLLDPLGPGRTLGRSSNLK